MAQQTFKFVDLLITLAIGVLACLILWPAIVTIQGRAWESRCADNQRRLAKACDDANSVLGSIPPYDSREKASAGVYWNLGGNYGSFLFHLLPFLDEEHLYDSSVFRGLGTECHAVSTMVGSGQAPINYRSGDPQGYADYSASPPEADTVLTQSLRVFVCPVDPTVPMRLPWAAPNGWAGTSYGGNFLVFANPYPVNLNDPDGLGGSNTPGTWTTKPRIPGSFPDGTSNTILFAERYMICGDGTSAGANTRGTAWAWSHHDAAFAPAVAMESPWNDGTRFQVLPTPSDCDVRYSQTGHWKGMNIVMADGSCRSVNIGVGSRTYLHAMQPNDGIPCCGDW
jgi:hypothetical protein